MPAGNQEQQKGKIEPLGQPRYIQTVRGFGYQFKAR